MYQLSETPLEFLDSDTLLNIIAYAGTPSDIYFRALDILIARGDHTKLYSIL